MIKINNIEEVERILKDEKFNLESGPNDYIWEDRYDYDGGEDEDPLATLNLYKWPIFLALNKPEILAMLIEHGIDLTRCLHVRNGFKDKYSYNIYMTEYINNPISAVLFLLNTPNSKIEKCGRLGIISELYSYPPFRVVDGSLLYAAKLNDNGKDPWYDKKTGTFHIKEEKLRLPQDLKGRVEIYLKTAKDNFIHGIDRPPYCAWFSSNLTNNGIFPNCAGKNCKSFKNLDKWPITNFYQKVQKYLSQLLPLDNTSSVCLSYLDMTEFKTTNINVIKAIIDLN